MDCKNCGSSNPDDEHNCSHCGAILIRPQPLKTLDASADSIAPVTSTQSVPTIEVNNRINNPLFGVSGWLLLFCFAQTIVVPITFLVAIIYSPNLIVTTICVYFATLAFLAGFSMWRARPKAFTILKIYFGSVIFLSLLILLPAIFQPAPSNVDLDSSNLFIGIRTLLPVLIWWTYFKKSERVRVTYGRNL